jgi:hypothetical protein
MYSTVLNKLEKIHVLQKRESMNGSTLLKTTTLLEHPNPNASIITNFTQENEPKTFLKNEPKTDSLNP